MFLIVVVVAVMMVLVVVVMIMLVVMIVLVLVVGGGGSGCDSVGGCVSFSFISYVFKSSVYFKQCYNMSIDKKQKTKKKNNSKTSYIVCIHAACLKKGNAVLHLCQLFLEFFEIF